MKRALAVSVLVLVMVPALVADATHGTTETYVDHFDSVSFSGNDGSLDWSGPWVEQGENDGPDRGAIVVTGSGCSGNCLQMKGGLLTGPAVSRTADLSSFGDARLEFEAELEPFLGLSTGLLFVEVREGGSPWKTVADYLLLTESNVTHSESIDISSHLGHDFEVRFRLAQIVGGDRARIDDVKIVGTVQNTTTSTTPTTTPPKPSSTTSTTSPTSSVATTATTLAPATTTSTSAPASAPTPTSVQETGGDPGSDPVDAEESTGTTTPPTITSSTTGDDGDVGVVAPDDGPTDPPSVPADGFTAPEGSGLRQSRVGLLADFRPGTVGGIGADDIEVLGVTLDADFSLAAEAFEATRLWIAGLALLIAIVLVSGMDMRWGRRIGPGGAREVSGSVGDHGGSETGA